MTGQYTLSFGSEGQNVNDFTKISFEADTSKANEISFLFSKAGYLTRWNEVPETYTDINGVPFKGRIENSVMGPFIPAPGMTNEDILSLK
jgi:hypothetical protein